MIIIVFQLIYNILHIILHKLILNGKQLRLLLILILIMTLVTKADPRKCCGLVDTQGTMEGLWLRRHVGDQESVMTWSTHI